MRVPALCAALALAAAPAIAAECPTEAPPSRAIATAPSEPPSGGVESEVLDEIDLADHYGIAGRTLRMRRLTLAPGAVVPWHGHDARPGMVTVLSGEVTEHRNTCAVPIVHHAGDTVREVAPIWHWWRNESAAATIVIVADLPPAPARP